MPNRASLNTVAKAAGVSPTTVSNAYNKPEHLSSQLRELIFTIAQDQGYAGPDPAARSLRSRHAGAIGMLFTAQLSYAFSDPYCIELLAGLAEVAERNRTSMLLIPLAPRRAASEEEVRQSVQAVRYAVIDGAVADGIDDGHPALQVLTSRGVPVIRSIDNPSGRCAIIEERAGGRSIGEHLAALGHRRIAVVVESVHGAAAGPTVRENELFRYSSLRLGGIRDGMGADAQVTVQAAVRNTVASGREAAEAILERGERPTAIAATSDVLAIGVIEALQQRRARVGAGGISVVGFDDIAMAATAGLTTVRQPIREKGRVMGRMLLDPSFVDQRVVLPTELVARTSTGPVHRRSAG
jgi:DNA-binding LacI/PurR family transcriptional regulator